LLEASYRKDNCVFGVGPSCQPSNCMKAIRIIIHILTSAETLLKEIVCLSVYVASILGWMHVSETFHDDTSVPKEEHVNFFEVRCKGNDYLVGVDIV